MNFTTVPGSLQGATLVSKFNTSNTGYEVILYNNTMYFQAQTANIGMTYAFTPTAGTWYHIAWTRSGANSYGFINGALVASTSAASGSITNLAQALQIGRRGDNTFYLTGYMSNVRVVKGTAVYTAAFTVPTTPLTAITNTSLLTCQASQFIDSSSNAFTITVNGNTSVQSFDPFYTATIASNGGSMYFDGTGDYISMPQSVGYLGSGNWTLECWAYSTATQPNYASLLNKNWTFSLATGDFQWSIKHSDGYMSFAYYNGGITNVTTTIAPVTNAWTHYAVTRSGTSLRIYANGVLNTTATLPSGLSFGTASSVAVYSGYNSRDGVYYTGYISGMRITGGTALYTGSTYTVPTTPQTPTAATTLLVNGMNAGAYDATAINNMETVGNAQVSTVQSKFGGSSMYFDGTGDYIDLITNQVFAFGTGAFTIEGWFYTNTTSGDRNLVDFRPTGTNGAYPNIFIAGGGYLSYNANGSVPITGTTAIATGTWYHFALARSGTSTKLFLNGVQEGSTYTDSTTYIVGDNRPRIATGGYGAGVANFNGYLDDVRITKGVARYTTTFTPPTQAFPPY